jgi:hypothetical protein
MTQQLDYIWTRFSSEKIEVPSRESRKISARDQVALNQRDLVLDFWVPIARCKLVPFVPIVPEGRLQRHEAVGLIGVG